MRRSFGALVLLLPAFLGAGPTQAQPIERPEIEGIVRDYILQNPEIIEEALTLLEQRKLAAKAEARVAAVRTEQTAILATDFAVEAGNPNGDVTLVEFFDFNCGYCRRAAPDVEALVARDQKLRVIYKDFPVLGPGSLAAAKVGLAVKRLHGDKIGAKFQKQLLASPARVDMEAALKTAAEIGLDRPALEKEAAGEPINAAIAANLALAQRLGLTGTPSFVVGETVVEGAVGEGLLAEAIASARK